MQNLVELDSGQSTEVVNRAKQLTEPLKRPTLKTIVAGICKDAKMDTALYLLRSNTSHDGE